MLQIKTNPSKKPAAEVTFESPARLKQHGVEMLIALNTTPKTAITGPEVNINAKILVTKEKPHFFFNPSVILDERDLQDTTDDSIITISYTNYQGNAAEVTIADEDGSIRVAIDRLHNGIKRANKKKV